MYKVCLFDLDGTLLDTVESIAYIANKVLAHYHLPAQPVKDFNYYAGDGANKLIERAFAAAGGDPKDIADAREMYKAMFAEDPLYKVAPYEGIVETLKALKANGTILTVCTNKPDVAARANLAAMFDDDMFTVIQALDSSVKRKPAPDMALKIAKELGVKAEECMYIGDTDTDMQTGKAAGMYTIGVLWGFRDKAELEANHADIIIAKPQELIAIQREG